MHVHDLLPFAVTRYNISHVINSLSFGERFPGAAVFTNDTITAIDTDFRLVNPLTPFTGRVNPLDAVEYHSPFESAM